MSEPQSEQPRVVPTLGKRIGITVLNRARPEYKIVSKTPFAGAKPEIPLRKRLLGKGPTYVWTMNIPRDQQKNTAVGQSEIPKLPEGIYPMHNAKHVGGRTNQEDFSAVASYTPAELQEHPEISARLKRFGQLMVDADGVGGANKGEVASNEIGLATGNYFYSDSFLPTLPPAERLCQAIVSANNEIVNKYANDPRYQGMGTTMVATVIHQGQLHVANVGDSRAYLVRGQNAFQLTEDDSLVTGLVKSGAITPAEAGTHPQRNVITKSLGNNPISPNYVTMLTYDLTPNGRIALFSYGVTEVLSPAQIASIISQANSAPEAAANIVNISARTSPDNCSTAVAFYQK